MKAISTVDDELRWLCSEERITKETFLEAAYFYLSENPVNVGTRCQFSSRTITAHEGDADYKRAKTMQQRFLNKTDKT